MKPKAIQLDIRSPHCRATGQRPPIGKVTRLRDSGAPSDHDGASHVFRPSRPSELGGNPALRKLIFLWSIALGAATTLTIGAAISFWILPYLRRGNPEVAELRIDHEARVRIASRFPSPGEDEALRMVKFAMANRDPAKVGELFHTGAAEAAEVIDFFERSVARDGAVGRSIWLSSIDGDGILLEGVQVSFKGNDKAAERLALLTPDHQGIWKMDFEAFARTVRPSWQELLEKQAGQATVRVYVGHDAYFNGPFSDEKQWTCYAIASPDIDVLLRGYCKAGSVEESAIERMLADGAKLCRATLEIRRVKDADQKQFEIIRVLAKDWVVADRNLTAANAGSK